MTYIPKCFRYKSRNSNYNRSGGNVGLASICVEPDAKTYRSTLLWSTLVYYESLVSSSGDFIRSRIAEKAGLAQLVMSTKS